MTGPASSIDFLLDAQNVADLTDRLAYVDALAQSDAELSVQVANRKNDSSRPPRRTLEEQQAAELRELEQARTQKRRGGRAVRRAAALLESQQRLLDRRGADLQDDEGELRRRGSRSSRRQVGKRSAGGCGTVAISPSRSTMSSMRARSTSHAPSATASAPPGTRAAITCTRGSTSWPRWGPRSRPPFDGYSYTSSNTLGGKRRVRGRAVREGLQRPSLEYSASSNGRVSAGRGHRLRRRAPGRCRGTPARSLRVPSERDAGSAWHESYYGYSVIEDAINPYPLLVQACG